MALMLEEMAERVRAGGFDEVAQSLDALEENDENRCQVLFLRGYLQERQYDWEGAIEHYSKALEVDPDHSPTAFRLALLLDQRDETDRALELYDMCVDGERIHVNALLNKAVILEEQGKLEDAERCVALVLEEHPTHVRAKYLERSIDSSFTMVFDEKIQLEREIRSAVLDVPVSDFELSVRSRNCLKQMDIRTLGDLLKTTEEELLAYKNFGETSLNEIKAMLSQKNLRLGQKSHDTTSPEQLATTTDDADNVAFENRSVSELELSVRSRKCLQRLGITTMGELTARSESELMTTKNFGQTSLSEIKKQLAQYGLSLRQTN